MTCDDIKAFLREDGKPWDEIRREIEDETEFFGNLYDEVRGRYENAVDVKILEKKDVVIRAQIKNQKMKLDAETKYIDKFFGFCNFGLVVLNAVLTVTAGVGHKLSGNIGLVILGMTMACLVGVLYLEIKYHVIHCKNIGNAMAWLCIEKEVINSIINRENEREILMQKLLK